MTRGWLVLVAACGPVAPNTLNERPARLFDVKPPHVALYVRTDDGVERVFLDTGAREVVSRASRAILVDEATFVHDEDGRFVIVKSGERTPLPDVKPSYGAQLSPDRRTLAIARDIEPAPLDKTQPDKEVVTIALADGSIRRYPMPNVGPTSPYLSIAWARSSDALLVSYDGWKRLDLATGALTPIDRAEYEAQTRETPLTECPARGLRLVERARNGQQEIVLVPTSSLRDPEHLSATTDRVLVTSTNHRRAVGDGAHFSGGRSGPLDVYGFLPGCEHFVFTLEGGVYVGNVETGRYALVIEGSQPELLPATLRRATP